MINIEITPTVQVQYKCFSKSNNFPSRAGITRFCFGGKLDGTDGFHF